MGVCGLKRVFSTLRVEKTRCALDCNIHDCVADLKTYLERERGAKKMILRRCTLVIRKIGLFCTTNWAFVLVLIILEKSKNYEF